MKFLAKKKRRRSKQNRLEKVQNENIMTWVEVEKINIERQYDS